MRSVSTRTWVIVVCVVLAFVIRLWFVTKAFVPDPVRGDALDYVACAVNLVFHHTFSVASSGAPVAPDNYRDPGYPTVLAAFIVLVRDPNARNMLLEVFQALLGSLTVGCYLLMGRRWFSAGWLALAGVLMAIWPHSVTAPLYLLSETLLGFLVALATWLVTAGLLDESRGKVLGGGVVFGMAALTNSVMAPFAPIIALAGIWLSPANRRLYAALLVASLVLPVAWGVRNFSAYGEPTASQRAITNFVQGSHPDYHSSWQWASAGDPRAVAASAAISAEVGRAIASPTEGLAEWSSRVSNEPGRYLAWYASKPALLWSWDMQIAAGHIYPFPTLNSPLEVSPWPLRIVSALVLVNPCLPWLALLTITHACLTRRARGVLLLAAMLLYVTCVYSILQAEPRYAVPFRGGELLLATAAIANIRPTINRIKRRVVLPKRDACHDLSLMH